MAVGGGDAQGGAGDGGGGATSTSGGTAGAPAGGTGGISGAGGAVTGAPPGTGGPALPCDPYVFCENFESYPPGPIAPNVRWTLHQGDRLKVDGVRPARGLQALHADWGVGADKFQRMRTEAPFPALAKQHYGRVFMYFDNIPDKVEYRHWVTLELIGNSPVWTRVIAGEGGNVTTKNEFILDQVEKPTAQGGNDKRADRGRSDFHLSEGKWHCLEWFYDSVNDIYQAWDNGELLVTWDSKVNKNQPYYDYAEPTYMWFGFLDFHPNQADWDVHLDELVMHTERIGCDK
ncbi:MAG: hypothetical protein RJA70_315 [Pseudomonadota bacterium]|jgi:hypothetical protein